MTTLREPSGPAAQMPWTAGSPVPGRRRYRRILGRFATGVAVVTTTGRADDPVGLTINAFASVSLDPPLILWCLGQESSTAPDFLHSPHFAVNILREDQRDIAEQFARSGVERFAGVDWQPGPAGVPVLAGTVATLLCRRTRSVPAGDHVVLFGEVTGAESHPGAPLGFVDGTFRAL